MKHRVKKLWFILNILRSFPAIISLYFSKSKKTIVKDIERWVIIKNPSSNYPTWLNLHWLLLNFQEFRNVYYFRIKKHNFFLSLMLPIFYKPVNTLFIYTDDIGEGFFIQHGFSTIIIAKKIGKNCSINQQVTIGYGSQEGLPIIGDDVLISSGAKVFGDITIGKLSKVGANCVVSKNVPENCTVVGIPGKIIRKDGERVDIAL